MLGNTMVPGLTATFDKRVVCSHTSSLSHRCWHSGHCLASTTNLPRFYMWWETNTEKSHFKSVVYGVRPFDSSENASRKTSTCEPQMRGDGRTTSERGPVRASARLERRALHWPARSLGAKRSLRPAWSRFATSRTLGLVALAVVNASRKSSELIVFVADVTKQPSRTALPIVVL
jgi:hypothetical protein